MIDSKNNAETSRGSWWKKVLDVEEAKNEALFSLPMILTNVSYYAITSVSVIFAGHLGKLELAGATLANSWAFVTGFAFMTGLSGALETLCGQGFGARLYKILEFWAFDILVFLAGLMPNPEVTTSLIAMCTSVSNELGAGNVNRAKNAMTVTLKLAVILALPVVLALAFGHNIWAGFFSNGSEIIRGFASMKCFLIVWITLDFMQAVLSGVLRGCGLQRLAVWANLSTFYFIGLPMSLLLGFKLKLYAKGLWIGLICGLSSQATTLLLITLCKNWTKLDIPVNRSGNEIPHVI
ncbi:hypothetical protein Pint_04599 [Pistacia integerrima]|uniref:Uncharacterized protein n=1 Tax=Pistacia integerrima TaxID=434235 RepID=A0ACC0Z8V2_9ROSI|nr:hypothetical protein Pint_04599 [Pistacia integerrima]